MGLYSFVGRCRDEKSESIVCDLYPGIMNISKIVLMSRDEFYNAVNNGAVLDISNRNGTFWSDSVNTSYKNLERFTPVFSKLILNRVLSGSGEVLLYANRLYENGYVSLIMIGDPDLVDKYRKALIVKYCKDKMFVNTEVMTSRYCFRFFIPVEDLLEFKAFPENSEGMILDLCYSECRRFYEDLSKLDGGKGINIIREDILIF